MTDATPTRQRHDVDTTVDYDVVSPTEAAGRLGITPDAVRARLRRGTIAGERIDGDWQVFLPRDTTPTEVSHDDRHDADTKRHDTDTTLIMSLLAAKDQAIAIQQEEIEFLRRQSEESDRRHAVEIERRDILLRQALGLIPALPALSSHPDHPVDSPTGQGDAIALNTTPGTLQVGRSWWRRLLGIGRVFAIQKSEI